MAVIISNEYDHVDFNNGTDINRHMFKDSTAREKYNALQNRYVGTPLVAEYVSNTLSRNAKQSVSVGSVIADVNIAEGTPFSITVIDSENGLTSISIRWYINNATSQSSPSSYANGQPLNTPLYYIAPAGGITRITLYAGASAVTAATTLQFIVKVYNRNERSIEQVIAPIEIGASTHYYDVGSYIMVNGALYKATTRIEPGWRIDDKIVPVQPKVHLVDYQDKLIRQNMGVYTSLIYEGHLMDTGAVNANEATQNFYTSGYLPIKIGETLHYRLVGANNYCIYVAYDAAKNVISSQQGTTQTISQGTYTAVSEGYVRICCEMTWAPDCYFYISPGQCNDYIRTKLSDIPNYWQSNLDNIRSKIITRDLSLTTGDRFFFITDPHWRSQKNKMSSRLISKISEEFDIGLCLIGGDIVASTSASAEDGYQELQKYVRSFKNPTLKLFATIGNHDVVNDIPTTQQAYNVLMKRTEQFAITSTDGLGSYYDNPSQRIRYIQFKYTGHENFSESIANWITSACQSTPTGYTIIVMSHSYWSGENCTGIPDASVNYANHLLGLKHSGANIALWLVGHCHIDQSTTVTLNDGNSSTKLLIVSATTDNVSSGQVELSGYARANNSNTESAFDIVHIDTTNTKIYFTRVGGWFAGAGDQPTIGDRAFDYSTGQPITYA